MPTLHQVKRMKLPVVMLPELVITTTIITSRSLLSRTTVALEMFAVCARLSAACASCQLNIGPPVDMLSGEWFDSSNRQVARCILDWLQAGLVWYVHLATPCAWASRARTTAKSCGSLWPLWFTAEVLKGVLARQLFFSIEDPKGAWLFEVPISVELLAKLKACRVLYDNCAWGATYRKCSELRTNCPPLCSLGRTCADVTSEHVHEHLEGTVRIPRAGGGFQTVWKTALAAKYPPQLCSEWARCLTQVAPPSAQTPPGVVALSPQWLPWLSAATGIFASKIPPFRIPTLPEHFTSGMDLNVSQ